jgi:phosphatidylglycerophosphatase C
MTAPETATPTPWVALFDLDGTLTWRDTLLPFLASYLRSHPHCMRGLWRLPWALARYAARGRDRGLLKSRVIGMVMGGASRVDVDRCAEAFVDALTRGRRLRPAALTVLDAHRAAGDHLVLLSASPDLYVPRIGRSLGFERTLCTEVQWQGDRLVGTLSTPNRHGVEKSRCLAWLRGQYPGLPIVAYGNSASDVDHMRRADQALLVNGNAGARALAQQWRIPTSNWT